MFNLNRISSNDTIEGWFTTYGSEFLVSNKDNSDEVFSLKV